MFKSFDLFQNIKKLVLKYNETNDKFPSWKSLATIKFLSDWIIHTDWIYGFYYFWVLF